MARGRETANTYGLPQGKAIRLALRDWFRAQRRAVVGYLKTGRIETKDDGGDITSLPGWDAYQLGDLPMSERMAPLIEAIWDAAGDEFLARLGLDPNVWNVTDPHLAEMIRTAAFAFCSATNATTTMQLSDAIEELRAGIAEGLIERGESLAWLTKRVNAVFDLAETWRARRIAASEASRAFHAAQYQSGIESGVVAGWRWLLSSDACPLCQMVARLCPLVKAGQPFAVIGDHPDYSTIRHPPLHPSCRCALTEVLDIDEQPAWGETLMDPKPEAADYAAAGVQPPKSLVPQ